MTSQILEKNLKHYISKSNRNFKKAYADLIKTYKPLFCKIFNIFLNILKLLKITIFLLYLSRLHDNSNSVNSNS